MASDSSCTSSIIDSGFESTSTHFVPIPPPRKKRIKKEIQQQKKGRKWSAVLSHHINKISNFIEKVA